MTADMYFKNIGDMDLKTIAENTNHTVLYNYFKNLADNADENSGISVKCQQVHGKLRVLMCDYNRQKIYWIREAYFSDETGARGAVICL